MARPRKNAGSPDARQRICEALWELLEAHELRDITIGMITERAECNRGTFYYHFKDLDTLLDAAIGDDVINKSMVAELVFRISTGDETAVREVMGSQELYRLSIVVNHAGIELAFSKVFEKLVDIWRALLCPEDEELTPDAQAIVLYYVGGMMSMIAAVPHDRLGALMESERLPHFIMDNARFIVSEICAAQGVPVETISERIVAVTQFMDSIR